MLLSLLVILVIFKPGDEVRGVDVGAVISLLRGQIETARKRNIVKRQEVPVTGCVRVSDPACSIDLPSFSGKL